MIGTRARTSLIGGNTDIYTTPGINGPARGQVVPSIPSPASPVTQPPVTILGDRDMASVVPVGVGNVGFEGELNERPAWSEGQPGLYKGGIGGILQHIGDAINAPGMKAALLRSGAATLTGGIGEGIRAGAGYMDQRKAQESAAERALVNDAFETRKLDQGDTRMANDLGVSVAQLGETRARRIGDQTLDARRIGVTAQGQQLNYDSSMTGHRVTEYGIKQRSADNAADRDVQVRGQDVTAGTQKYVADRNATGKVEAAGARPAGIGSKANKAPAKLQAQAVVLPSDATAADLDVGTIYRTPQGLGQWNGRAFVAVQ